MTGVSRTPQNHGSNIVYQRLRERGYQLYPVNPNADRVEGDACNHDLASIPGAVEAVIIGTKPETAGSTMRECVQLGINQGECTAPSAQAACPSRPPSTAGSMASP